MVCRGTRKHIEIYSGGDFVSTVWKIRYWEVLEIFQYYLSNSKYEIFQYYSSKLNLWGLRDISRYFENPSFRNRFSDSGVSVKNSGNEGTHTADVKEFARGFYFWSFFFCEICTMYICLHILKFALELSARCVPKCLKID